MTTQQMAQKILDIMQKQDNNHEFVYDDATCLEEIAGLVTPHALQDNQTITPQNLHDTLIFLGAEINYGDCDIHYYIDSRAWYLTNAAMDENDKIRKLTDEEKKLYGTDGIQEFIQTEPDDGGDLVMTTIKTF